MNDHVSACRHGQLSRVCRECELEAEIEALRAQVAETRELLAHTVMGSLPNDWPLKDVAEARLHDMIALRNQVRDTCVRAEQAEAKLADALSLLAHKGHDADCESNWKCATCGNPHWARCHLNDKEKGRHDWVAAPCSDTCGYSRCVGVE